MSLRTLETLNVIYFDVCCKDIDTFHFFFFKLVPDGTG